MASLLNMSGGRLVGGSKSLPYDCEVEYLGFTGIQRFRTASIRFGDISSISYTVSVDITTESCVIGNRVDSASSKSLEFFLTGNSASFWTRQDGAKSIACKPKAEKTYVKFEFSDTNVTILAKSDSVDATRSFSPVSNAIADYTYGTLWVGSYDNSTDIAFKGNLYSLKIEKNGVIWYDFIPVRKGTIGYMYDKVSGQLFGNQGTGNFILGPDKQ